MKTLFCVAVLCFHQIQAQQREVAVTLDDVPNTLIYQRGNNSSQLLHHITALGVPVAIFINEGKIYNSGSITENKDGLAAWLKNKNITAGNHSFSHLNCADVGIRAFQEDVIKGEILTKEILKQKNQSLTYFRFPYNSLGKDSISHLQMKHFLDSLNYALAPFTIESEDWMYNALYEEALKNGNREKALQLGRQYVTVTLVLFDYFEKLCLQRFGRNIKQIYLCHDNQLNTDFLPEVVNQLRTKGYSFISLDAALKDPIYKSREFYFGRAGFSWIYRWEPDDAKRKMLLRAEPDNVELHTQYDQLVKRQSAK